MSESDEIGRPPQALPPLPDADADTREADAREPDDRRPLPAYATADETALAGRVALVSGGEEGIGRAVALALAAAGADVAITYRDAHEAARATMELVQEAGRETLAIMGDVGRSEFCDDVVAETIRRFGRLDILVHAAAAAVPTGSEAGPADGSLDRLDDARIAAVLDVGLRGALYLARAALPHLQEGATIVNTAHDSPAIVSQACAAAVVGATRAMAHALAARGIRVNAVQGPAPLPISAAATYVFLASTQSAPMTGEVLHPAPDVG